MDDLIIKFIPFNVLSMFEGIKFEGEKFYVDGKLVFGAYEVEWCSWPDLLLEENNRHLIGFSFYVYKDYEREIRSYIREINHPNITLAPTSDLGSRYGNSLDKEENRLELYWEKPKGTVVYEPASLCSHGSWLYEEKEKSPFRPMGFRVSLLNDLKKTHDLI